MGYSLPPLAFFEITPVHKHTESLIMPLSVQLETPHSGKYEQPTGLFINNEFVKGAEGKTFEVINPSTEEVITSVHEATEKISTLPWPRLARPSRARGGKRRLRIA